MNQPVLPIPVGLQPASNRTCEDAARGLSFCQKAFDAVEISRVVGMSDTIVSATLRIGNWYIMVCDDFRNTAAAAC